MTATEFISNWLELRSELLKDFLEGNTEVASQLKSLELSAEQTGILRQAVDGILRDTMYTLLLGLDGCASIGSSQQSYTLFDETESSFLSLEN